MPIVSVKIYQPFSQIGVNILNVPQSGKITTLELARHAGFKLYK